MWGRHGGEHIGASTCTSSRSGGRHRSRGSSGVLIAFAAVAAAVSASALAVGALGPPPRYWRGWQKQQHRLPAVDVSTCNIATTTRSRLSRPTRLYDICEWRDIVFDVELVNDDPSDGSRVGGFDDSPPREVCVLPFPFEDVLLIGETKELRLYEDRFISLFDDAMENYGGTVAMGLLAENGIIQTIPLCEIEAYNRMDGFGIFVTVRMVSRAALLGVTQETPYIKAVCKEIFDEVQRDNSDVLDVVAGNIDIMLVTLSSIEHRLKDAEGKVDAGLASIDDDDVDDVLDRTGRFRKAFQVARASDTQGYILASEDNSSKRSVQDLAAISWAAFQTDRLHGDDEGGAGFVGDNGQLLASSDVLFRMRALACENLGDRLKLASSYLQQKNAELKKSLEKGGIKYDDGETMDM